MTHDAQSPIRQRFYGTDSNDWCEVLSEVTIMEDGTYSIATVLVEKLSEP